MRTLKRLVARAASALGLLPALADAFLYARARAWRGTSGGGSTLDPSIPPPMLRHSSTGTADPRWFLESGRRGAEVVREVMRKCSVPPRRILDFGCGSGRVARHLLAEDQVFHGVDWNEAVIRWCQKHLLQGRFLMGGLRPPLPLEPDLELDLIYAFSVFTHMTEDLQQSWLEELGSRLAVGGVLAISTHGRAFVENLSAEERARFERGELVVREPVAAGTNVCAAYHPPGSLEALLPPSLEVWQHLPEAARGNAPQDLWLLRRR